MASLVVEEPHEQAHQQCGEQQIGQEAAVAAQDAAEEVAAGQGPVALLEAADGLVAGDDLADAVDQGLHTQGGDEGGNLQKGDDAAVHRAEAGHDGQGDQQGHEPGHVGHPVKHPGAVIQGLLHHGGKAGGQTHLAARRQVRALGDQAPGHAAGDDEPGGHVGDQVAHVVSAEEVLAVGPGDNGQQDDQENNGVIGNEFNDALGVQRLSFCLSHSYLFPPYSNWVARAMMFS